MIQCILQLGILCDLDFYHNLLDFLKNIYALKDEMRTELFCKTELFGIFPTRKWGKWSIKLICYK